MLDDICQYIVAYVMVLSDYFPTMSTKCYNVQPLSGTMLSFDVYFGQMFVTFLWTKEEMREETAMQDQQEYTHSAWRVIIGQVVRQPEERQRLADEIDVNPITLTRWARLPASDQEGTGERVLTATPRKDSLIKLVNALPAYRDTLKDSLMEEFPRMFREEDFLPRQWGEWEATSIPVNCYEQVLQAAATLPAGLRSTTAFDRLLEFAIQQFDPERFGFLALVVLCTRPPEGEKVRSLREQFRKGTPPWRMEREERNLFLGAESLAGHTVETGKPYVVEDIRSYTGWLPLHRTKYEVSVATCPIMRLGQVAGCLLFSSTQPGYFTVDRMALLQKYAHLALEAFDPADFYASHDIALRLMPQAERQEPLLRLYPKRVEDLQRAGQARNWQEAALQAMRELEDNLIYLATTEEEIAQERS